MNKDKQESVVDITVNNLVTVPEYMLRPNMHAY